jgi:hypothetical protein
LLQSLGLRFAQDKLHRKDGFFLKNYAQHYGFTSKDELYPCHKTFQLLKRIHQLLQLQLINLENTWPLEDTGTNRDKQRDNQGGL